MQVFLQLFFQFAQMQRNSAESETTWPLGSELKALAHAERGREMGKSGLIVLARAERVREGAFCPDNLYSVTNTPSACSIFSSALTSTSTRARFFETRARSV